MKSSELLDLQTDDFNELNEERESSNVVDSNRLKRIEGSPFSAVMRGDEWIIILGNAMASKMVFDTFEECEEWVNQIDWDMIMTFMVKTLEICEVNVEFLKNN